MHHLRIIKSCPTNPGHLCCYENGKAAVDSLIGNRRWLLIDIDTIRGEDESASNDIILKARNRMAEINKYLEDRGFSSPIEAFSGNGYHLLYGIDLPNEDESRDMVKECLAALDFIFSDEEVRVDTSVYNASRLTRLYGTINLKGKENSRSKLLSRNDGITNARCLRELAQLSPKSFIATSESKGFDLSKWVEKYLSDNIKKEKLWNSRRFYELLVCPFNEKHDRGEAFVGQLEGGRIVAGCLHDSCEWRWRDLRQKYEPDAYSDDESEDCGEQKWRQTDAIVKIGLSHELFRTREGTPYAAVEVNGGDRIIPIRSNGYKALLQKLYYDKEKKPANRNAVSSAIGTLEGFAMFDGETHELNNRVAWFEDAIWYDLANDESKAIRVTKHGYEVKDCPLLFRRYAHQGEQVEPSKHCDINELLNYINVEKEDDKVLLLVYLVSCYIPDIPHPILIITGDHGSAKTSALVLLRMLIDPSCMWTLDIAQEKGELIQTLAHNYAVPFDNVGGLNKWQSNLLCRAVTGEGYSKRQLYTDDEDIIYKFRRVIMLNSIHLMSTRPDFLDRGILIELFQIPKEERKPEKTLFAEFEKDKPQIMGGIMSALSKTLEIYPRIELDMLPRMADFTQYGYAIAEALDMGGDKFINAYFRNIEGQNEIVVVNNPVGDAILKLMENTDCWEGTPTELFNSSSTVDPRF